MVGAIRAKSQECAFVGKSCCWAFANHELDPGLNDLAQRSFETRPGVLKLKREAAMDQASDV